MVAVAQAGGPKPGAKRSAIFHRSSMGALALSGASAIRLTLQFALLPILARLIGPAEYGLVSLAMPFILLANVLADGGMGVALGRQKDASPTLESTVFWLAAGIGALLALLCAAAAWPMGALLGQPRLPPLILALAPIMLLNALTAASNGRIIREGRFSVFAAGDLISTGASAATALFGATHGWGAWSLVAQQLVLWICKMAWVIANGRAAVGWRFEFQAARPLLVFGVSTIGATLADYLSRNLDNMIVGGALGVTALGHYAMAYQIIRVPDMLISWPLHLYIFTAVARASHDGAPDAVQDLAAAGLRLGSAAIAPLFCGLALVADLAVPLVLGDKWLEAIAPLRWLSGAGFCFCMLAIMSCTAMALGRSALQLSQSIILGVATIAMVVLSVRFGLVAVSASLFIATASVGALYVHRLAGELKMRRRRLVGALGPAAAGCAVMAVTVITARDAMVELHASALAEFMAMVLLGGAAYVATLALVARRRLLAGARAFARAHADKSPEVAEAPVPAVA